MSIQRAAVSLDHSKNTAFFLYASVILPGGVTDDKGGRVGLPYAWVDMLKNPVIDMTKPIAAPNLTSSEESESGVSVAQSGNLNRVKMSVANTPTLSNKVGNTARVNRPNTTVYVGVTTTRINFNGYGVDISDLVVDLSREGPDNYAVLTPSIMSAKWQGVFARKASVTLPTDTWKVEGSKPVVIPAANCFIDSNGFNGEIDASADSLKGVDLHGFNPKLNKLHVIFGRSSVLAGDCTGSTAVPGFEGTIPLTIKIGDTDATARITDTSTLVNKKLGLSICALSGSLLPGLDDRYALWLNGAIVLDVPGYDSLKNAGLAFHNLGIDNGGRFVTASEGRLNLDVPADVDFGPFRCNLSSLAFCTVNGSDPNNPKWLVDMNGELSLNNDFPVSSSIDYKYLQIVEGASKPEVSYSDIKVVADVLSVVRISSTLKPRRRGQIWKMPVW